MKLVIHVNMLKEGWDVTNLYPIVPLRAANARTLIEQSIGRGLRLPYGRRTGVGAVDRLNSVAHDHFQEIIDEANRGDSPIRLKQLILDAPDEDEGIVSVQVVSTAEVRLGLGKPEISGGGGHYALKTEELATVGFDPFTLDVSGLHLQPVEREIVIHELRTNEQRVMSSAVGIVTQVNAALR